MKDLVYYRKTVRYPVVVRFFEGDAIGKLLTNSNEFASVDREKIRDFKIANKKAIVAGLIIEDAEPSVEWETPNSLTDADMDEILKSYLKLKALLADLTSLPIAHKLLERAKEQNKSNKLITLIQNRVEELDEDYIDPALMRGVDNG